MRGLYWQILITIRNAKMDRSYSVMKYIMPCLMLWHRTTCWFRYFRLSAASKREMSTRLAKEHQPISRMYFAMLHQDSMCNGVWFLVWLLPRVEPSPFSEKHEVNLTFLAFMSTNTIAVSQSLLSHLGNHDPAHCSHVTWLLIKSVGVMTVWLWGRCSCHSRYPACSAATENCEVRVSPTVSSGTSLLLIWP